MLTFKYSFVVCVILNKVKNLNAQTRCIQILRFAQNDTSDGFLFLSR